MSDMKFAKLPTEHGDFKTLAYGEALVLVKGDVRGKENVLCRVHSECLTGDVFHSRRCDCGEQLEEALRRIEKANSGIFIYLRQEGRGIGLENKINAYKLQDEGLDTVEANEALGLAVDARDYAKVAEILIDLDVKSIRLLTNNPEKVEDLQLHGVIVSKRIPIKIPSNPHNKKYLQTKKEKMRHQL